MPKVIAIAALDDANLIGTENKLPWHIPEDMQRFKALTLHSNMLMGRNTYESLPAQFRPLPKRHSIVASRNPAALDVPAGVDTTSDPVAFIKEFKAGQRILPMGETLWILGGAQIYQLCLELCDELQLTRVNGTHIGDAYFPSFEGFFQLLEQERHSGYNFERWVKAAR